MPYEGYARKRSKCMPTGSYFYLERQPEKFMTSTQKMSNLHGLKRTQKMSMEKMGNLHVCYTDDSESKSVHANKRK